MVNKLSLVIRCKELQRKIYKNSLNSGTVGYIMLALRVHDIKKERVSNWSIATE